MFIHQEKFLFCRRKSIHHFDEYTNSKHEGANLGLKYNAAPVGPSHRLDSSTAILTSNAKRKSDHRDRKNSKQLLSTKPACILPCGKKLIDRGASLLSNEWIARNNYESIKVESNVWYCRYIYEYRYF